jgi:hypothetical protein
LQKALDSGGADMGTEGDGDGKTPGAPSWNDKPQFIPIPLPPPLPPKMEPAQPPVVLDRKAT